MVEGRPCLAAVIDAFSRKVAGAAVRHASICRRVLGVTPHRGKPHGADDPGKPLGAPARQGLARHLRLWGGVGISQTLSKAYVMMAAVSYPRTIRGVHNGGL